MKDQVQVPLPVPRLDIMETTIGGLGKHVQAWRQENDLGRRDRKLSLLGAGRRSGDTDNVATTEDGVGCGVVL
jgi:hypothetical protein